MNVFMYVPYSEYQLSIFYCKITSDVGFMIFFKSGTYFVMKSNRIVFSSVDHVATFLNTGTCTVVLHNTVPPLCLTLQKTFSMT